MLLIHGVGLNADCWDKMLPRLAQHFTVTAIDLPGHGESSTLAGRGEVTLTDYSSKLANTLSASAGQTIIVGHSLGALIALELAIRHPKTVAAVLPLNAIFRRTAVASAAVKARAKELASLGIVDPTGTLERWFGQSPIGPFFDAHQNCERMLKSTQPEGYAAAYHVFANSDGPSDNELRSLEAPMLCITGSEEPNSTPAMSEALATLAQDGQAVIIEGARHMMPMTHADEVTGHILDFAKLKDLLDV